MASRSGLVAFDLDGTLLRGPTVCELLAAPLGRSEEMRCFETFTSESDITRARVEMAGWYRGHELAELRRCLGPPPWAPGAGEAVRLLRREGVEIAIASITWSFAVEWLAGELGVRHFLGTGLGPTGEIEHVWGADKGRWVSRLAADLGVPPNRVAAVGDSPADEALLGAASVRIFVGAKPPAGLRGLVHLPGANLRVVAGRILDEWADAERS